MASMHVADERRRDDALGAEQVGEAHGAADDAPQDVAAVLVRRHDAVVDEEGHRAGVVGDDLEGDVGPLVAAPSVRPVTDCAVSTRPREDVGLAHGVDAVDRGEHPLEAGAGVDVVRRQLVERAVGPAEVAA